MDGYQDAFIWHLDLVDVGNYVFQIILCIYGPIFVLSQLMNVSKPLNWCAVINSIQYTYVSLERKGPNQVSITILGKCRGSTCKIRLSFSPAQARGDSAEEIKIIFFLIPTL